MNRSGNGRNVDEAQTGEKDFGIEVCGDGDWASRAVVVIVCCPSEVDAVEGTVDFVLWWDSVREQKERKLLVHTV